MEAPFEAGTFARIGAVLKEDEDRTDFVRMAVAYELERRAAPTPDDAAAAGRLAADLTS